ncbi:MAG TPA: thiamine pyrophosphate-binding protein [Gemmataceae bacterium]|nr:thiamine pyrophosphate-binding protein [Gemmataceae bacterium]
MFDGPSVVAALEDCGVTHVVWLPDSDIGRWEPALGTAARLQLLRVCREGEAVALAAGLLLGGKRPIVLIQCTGLFEAGDSLRNILYDLHLPLFFVIGVRSYYAHQRGASVDSCPVFTEPILRAWQLPHVLLNDNHTVADLASAYRQAQAKNQAFAVLLAE